MTTGRISSRVAVFSQASLTAVILSVYGNHCAAQSVEGQMIRVVATQAQITLPDDNVRQKIGGVSRNTRIWALREEGAYYRVIEPKTLKEGRLRKQDAVVIGYTSQQNREVGNSFGAAMEGRKLSDAGRHAEAEDRFRSTMRVMERNLGSDHPVLARAIMDLAKCLEAQKKHDDAAVQYRRALTIYQKTTGLDDTSTGGAFYSLVYMELARGRFDAAEKLIRQMIAACKTALGTKHPRTAMSMHMLARCYSTQGRYSEAKAPCQQALEAIDATLGSDHEYAGNIRTELAVIFKDGGDLEAAEPLMKAVLDSRERTLGPEHPLTATGLNNVAVLYNDQGKHSLAVPLLQRALRITEKVRGPDHPEVAIRLNNLAGTYQRMGQPHRVQPLYERTLKIHQDKLGPEHPLTASALENLAGIHEALGRPDQARTLTEQAFALREKVLGPNHPDTAKSLNNLGGIHRDEGNYSEARRLYERMLDINESVLGPEHPNTGLAIRNLAWIFIKEENYSKAEEYLRRAVSISEKSPGPNHPDTAYLIADVGSMKMQRGDYTAAKSRFDRAQKTLVQTLGADHPRTAALQFSQVRLQMKLDNSARAVTILDDVMRTSRRHLSTVLPGLPEAAQTSYLDTRFRGYVTTALSLGLAHRDDQHTANLSMGWLVNTKAIEQEARAEAAMWSAPEAASLVQELRGVRRRLSQLVLRPGHETDPDLRKLMTALQTRQTELQKEISAFGLRRTQQETWTSAEALTSSIPAEAVLINIARFTEQDFSSKNGGTQPDAPVYAAWIVPASGQGSVSIVKLGDAEKTDQLVAAVRAHFAPDVLQNIAGGNEEQLEGEYRKSAAQLSKMILHPLEPYLQKTKELIISPDGRLWTIPWEALLTGDSLYACEKYRIRYVLSGRELINKPEQKHAITRPVIFADPDFNLNHNRLVAGRATAHLQLRSMKNSRFPRLTGSAVEAAIIQSPLEKHTGTPATMLLGESAQEATFKALHRPQVLVMSTHGYFETSADSDSESAWNSNPLLRCGLALAGCNNRATVDSDREDGILTGLEIVGTDLHGTELVVLSACETGLGEVQNGEGVAGLRQAFQLAGANSVVSSLWQVEDRETARLMADFFQNLAQQKNKSQALRQAKLNRIHSRRERFGAAHPFFWAAFTLTGRDSP